MTPALFLLDAAAVAAAGVGDVIELAGAEGRHAIVRRTEVGERIDVADGAGTLLRARVEQVGGRDVVHARVESRVVVPAPQPRVVVVQALAKGDRAETAVETLTEVGVDVIVPWQADRSVARWSPPRQQRSQERWLAAARAAAKQSRRPWLPEVRPLAHLDDVLALAGGSGRAVVLHEQAREPIGSLSWPESGDILLVVGPEGGVSPDELRALAGVGAISARLGPTVLRTSTAGTVAAGVVLSRTARWA